MIGGRAVSPRLLASVGLATAAVVYVVGRWWFRRGGVLPEPSWLTALVVGALAGGLVYVGRRIAATRAGTARRPIHPIGVYRMLVVAQAAALTGAVLVGAYLALAGVFLPDVDFPSVRTRVIVSVVLAASGASLVGAGLWVQRVCRIDDAASGADGEGAQGVDPAGSTTWGG